MINPKGKTTKEAHLHQKKKKLKKHTMAILKPNYSLAIFVILFAVSGTTSQRQCNPACKAKEPFNCDNILTFNRTGFPKNFTFGVSTSAYQVEKYKTYIHLCLMAYKDRFIYTYLNVYNFI